MEYKMPKYMQLCFFAGELLRMTDEGQEIPIDEVCVNIEAGTIVQFVKTRCGFKDLSVTVESVEDVNDILKNKYVCDNEAQKMGFCNNGLLYITRLIIDDLMLLLSDMDNNDIKPELFRRALDL